METVLRVVIFYVFVLACLRIMGKREFSQLSPLELVSLLLVPELVGQGIVRDDFSIVTGLTSISTLFVLVFFTSLATHRFKGVERMMHGAPSVLVQQGRMIERTMDVERVTAGELFGEMRKAGLERLDQVKWAILEGDGRFSFIPAEGSKGDHQEPEQSSIT